MFAEYAKYYDLFNSDKPYKNEIEFVYRWSAKPRYILDIGCGTAKYWKYYPKATQIVGLEKSQDMISISPNKPFIVCGDVYKRSWNKKNIAKFDCATALFDVINYIPRHDWWKNIPVEKGGFFIFDIWDKEQVDRQGFRETYKKMGKSVRVISPVRLDRSSVDLMVKVFLSDILEFSELHTMYLHSHADIERFCGKEFEIVEVKPTKRWQTFYKLRRK